MGASVLRKNTRGKLMSAGGGEGMLEKYDGSSHQEADQERHDRER